MCGGFYHRSLVQGAFIMVIEAARSIKIFREAKALTIQAQIAVVHYAQLVGPFALTDF